MNPTPLPSRRSLEMADKSLPWRELESLVHRDPAGRGLASFRRRCVALDHGQLRAASLHLAEHARRVAILTGFPVALDDRVTAETDGPPGALYLAKVLDLLEIETAIVTDRPARPLVEAGCRLMDLASSTVHEVPRSTNEQHDGDFDAWMRKFLSSDWSHLIAIERPGPSHTSDSIRAQRRTSPAPMERFLQVVPPEDRDACHTMRGDVIDAQTAPAHRLFDAIQSSNLPIATIGIGDGGNELGMGSFLWEDLVEAIATGEGARIACRVASDFALLAGTSNWGGYALALAVARLRGLHANDHCLTPAGQAEIIAAMIAAGGVDGRTRQGESTVDGLAMEAYLQPLEEMLALTRY